MRVDENLQDIYKDIRFSTYGVMREIAEVLGSDFCCWKTDCIFFYDTEENRHLVTAMIEDTTKFGIKIKWVNKIEDVFDFRRELKDIYTARVNFNTNVGKVLLEVEYVITTEPDMMDIISKYICAWRVDTFGYRAESFDLTKNEKREIISYLLEEDE